jgi:hypothetical protein
MPSIEILSVDQYKSTVFGDFPFALLVDPARQSHRSPSRFQHDFDQVRGILYHLGNPDMKQCGGGQAFFAYKLLSRESQNDGTFLEFAADYRRQVESLLSELLRVSPVHRVLFTSDWQFGPEWVKHERSITLDRFWSLHDSRSILLNALYPIDSGIAVTQRGEVT